MTIETFVCDSCDTLIEYINRNDTPRTRCTICEVKKTLADKETRSIEAPMSVKVEGGTPKFHRSR